MIELIKQIFSKLKEIEKKVSNNYKRYQGLAKKIKKIEDNLKRDPF